MRCVAPTSFAFHFIVFLLILSLVFSSNLFLVISFSLIFCQIFLFIHLLIFLYLLRFLFIHFFSPFYFFPIFLLISFPKQSRHCRWNINFLHFCNSLGPLGPDVFLSNVDSHPQYTMSTLKWTPYDGQFLNGNSLQACQETPCVHKTQMFTAQWQHSRTGSCPEPYKLSPHPQNLFTYSPLQYSNLLLDLANGLFPFSLPGKVLCEIWPLLSASHNPSHLIFLQPLMKGAEFESSRKHFNSSNFKYMNLKSFSFRGLFLSGTVRYPYNSMEAKVNKPIRKHYLSVWTPSAFPQQQTHPA
jgi:hypothetical protein